MLEKIFEDKRFLETMDKETNGHHQIPLSFRNADVTLPNSQQHAMTRLRQLEKRFERDRSFFSDYKYFINDIVSKGYARKVFDQLVAAGRTWYIPHHGVYHPAKLGKI